MSGMPGACGSRGRRRARTRTAAPAARAPGGRRRRSSGRARRGASRGSGCPARRRSQRLADAGRPASIRAATYIVVTGSPARSASTTELRPATTSLEALPLRAPPRTGAGRAAAARLRRPARPGPAWRRVVLAVGGLGRRTLALEAATTLAAGPDGRRPCRSCGRRRGAGSCLASGLRSVVGGASDQAPAGPEAVSSMAMPSAARAGRGWRRPWRSRCRRAPLPRLEPLAHQCVDHVVHVGARRGARAARRVESGLTPSTLGHRDDAAAAAGPPASSPSSSAVLPSRMVSWTTASAPETLRSSSIAARNGAGHARRTPSSERDPPARSRKPSIRPTLAAASSSDPRSTRRASGSAPR